jgi:hypothetical protein
MIRAFKDKSCVTVALYDVGNRELAKQYSTAIMDPEGRIVDFREKPDNPETTLVGTCIYILPQRTLSRLNEYLIEAADRDNPGRFIAWLCKREPVYGHVLDGCWWDIGTIGQYNEANQRLELERVSSPISLAGGRPSIRRFKDLEPVLYDGAFSGNIDSEFPVYAHALCLERSKPFESLGKHWVQKPSVAVVIPTMNEAGCVEKVLRDTGKYLENSGVVVVVDASSDETPDIAARVGAKVLRQQGRGKGSAMREAFDTTDGEIVVIMDGDGSMRAGEIPRFVRAVSSGADMVKGSRFLPGGGSEDLSLIRRIGNSLFLSLVNLLWSTKYTDLCYGYIAFRRDALRKLKPYLESDGFQIETEICIKAKKLGLRVLEVPSFELRRSGGKSKIRAMNDSFLILKTILAEWLSDFSHPG